MHHIETWIATSTLWPPFIRCDVAPSLCAAASVCWRQTLHTLWLAWGTCRPGMILQNAYVCLHCACHDSMRTSRQFSQCLDGGSPPKRANGQSKAELKTEPAVAAGKQVVMKNCVREQQQRTASWYVWR